MRALARLQRVWGKKGASTNGRATELASSASQAGTEGRQRARTVQRRCGMAMSCASE